MTALTQRLQELLDIRDQQLAERDDTIRKLEYQLQFGVDWMRHKYREKDTETLPLPRLHLMRTQAESYHQEFCLYLITDSFGGSLTQAPLAYSKYSGSSAGIERIPGTGEMENAHIAELPSLVFDAAFQMESLKLPLFVQLDEKRIYKVTSGRPLKLHAV